MTRRLTTTALIAAAFGSCWLLAGTAAAGTSETIVYNYDQLGRLSGVIYGTQGFVDYRYDANGSLLEKRFVPAPTPVPVDSQAIVFQQSISDTEFPELRVAFQEPGWISGRLELGATRGADCVLDLVLIRSDGVVAATYADIRDVIQFQARSMAGIWTFQLHAKGGCVAQSFRMDVALSSIQPLPSGLTLGAAMLAFCLVGFLSHDRMRRGGR